MPFLKKGQKIRAWVDPPRWSWSDKSQNVKNHAFSHVKIICVFSYIRAVMLQKIRKWTQVNRGQLCGPFSVHFKSHWSIWGPLDGSKAKFRSFWDRFRPSLTLPANSVKFLWSLIACTGVSRIRNKIGTFGKSDRFRTKKNGTSSGQIKILRPLL